MAFGFSSEEQRQWAERNRARVEEKTGAPVLAYSVFYRTGSWGAMGAQHVSPLAASAIKLIGKKKAGGLPSNFILAVTADKLHAYKYKQRRNGIQVGDEVAIWLRSALRVTARETAMTMRVTIESPSEGETVQCDTGKAEITDQFLAELGAAPAVAA
jgi:hypothetical protein